MSVGGSRGRGCRRSEAVPVVTPAEHLVADLGRRRRADIADDHLRHRMAGAALDSARRYDPVPIAARYDQLFAGLRLTRARRAWRRRITR